MILSVSQFETRRRLVDEWTAARELHRFHASQASRPRGRARWFTRIMRAAVARTVGALRAESSAQGPCGGNPVYWPNST
jgi:hypothetical protein